VKAFSKILIWLVVLSGIVIVGFFSFQTRDNKLSLEKLDQDLEELSKDRDELIDLHKKYIKAMEQLKNRVKAAGNRLTSKIYLSQTLSQTGQMLATHKMWELAVKNYEIGLEVFPEEPVLNYNLALAFANLGAIYLEKTPEYWKKAETHYLRAIEFGPELSPPRYGLSLLYLSMFEKNIDKTVLPKALKTINDYIQKNPKMTDGYFVKARTLFLMDNKALALEQYNNILGLAKEDTSDYKNALRNVKLLQQEIKK